MSVLNNKIDLFVESFKEILIKWKNEKTVALQFLRKIFDLGKRAFSKRLH